jgi:Restriction endonuclease BglII
VETTGTWRRTLPGRLLDRFRFVETRSATAVLQATNPDEFADMVSVLDRFFLDVDRIVRPGGSKHKVARELDTAFRDAGWREARYEQTLETRLHIERWEPAGEQRGHTRVDVSNFGGHKIDNVKSRVGLDVEWNPKDGNLDRDLSNFRALYDAGQLDVGIILTRMQDGLRSLFATVIAEAKAWTGREETDAIWQERVRKTPDDPLGTSTTSNMEKLIPRIERGDGGGCPVLAIAITDVCYSAPHPNLHAEFRRLADLGGRDPEARLDIATDLAQREDG